MTDSIVSVRMPEALLEELKKAARDQHYMDLSEAIRSMIRNRLAEHYSEIDNGHSREQLIQGLQRLISQLENAEG